jgi:hypothetical protein
MLAVARKLCWRYEVHAHVTSVLLNRGVVCGCWDFFPDWSLKCVSVFLWVRCCNVFSGQALMLLLIDCVVCVVCCVRCLCSVLCVGCLSVGKTLTDGQSSSLMHH